MSAGATFYNTERVAFKGSVILEAARRRLSEDNRERRALMGVGSSSVSNVSMTPKEFHEWLDGVRQGTPSVQNEQHAMRVTAIYASVALLGGAVLSLPLKFYRGSKEERTEFKPDEWWLFNEQWSALWAAAPAWEYGMQALLLHGGMPIRIHRASRLSPKVAGLEPLHPLTVEPIRIGDRVAYRVDPQPSQLGIGETITLDQDDVLYIPGPGFDGLRGMSQIKHVLATPGSIALNADRNAEAFFLNSARPDYALATDRPMSPDQVKTTRDQLLEKHQGSNKRFLPIILTGGLKVQPITMSAEDAQLIEQRRFAIEDIARAFGVPPFMIGQTDKVTAWGTGLEQISLGFIKYTLQRHCVKIEQEINRKIFRNAGRFCEFDFRGLERADIKTRTSAYRTALGRAGENAWLTLKEVRRAETLPTDADSMAELAEENAQRAASPAPASAPGEEDDGETKMKEAQE